MPLTIQYLTPSNGGDVEYDIPPPKTPDYHPNVDDIDLDMTDQNEENYEEQSPPPSQPRPAKNNQSLSNKQNERENDPPKQDLPKRDLKRKHVDHSAMEAKIAKTEQSIEKLE